MSKAQKIIAFTVYCSIFSLSLEGNSVSAPQLEHVTILRDDTQYYITPWLSRLQNGDLVLTVREAHARHEEQRGHVDPTARGILLRSRDGGRTWSSKRVVDDQTYRFSQTEDVYVTELSDGSQLINTYSWAVSPLPAGFPVGLQKDFFARTFEGLWTLRSTDNGATWTERRPVEVAGLPPISARAPAIELPDHTLIMAVYDEKSKRSGLEWSRCWLIRSNDMGLTWHSPSLIAEDPDHRRKFEEPSLVRLKNGELLSMIRTTSDKPDDEESYLWQSNSADDGRTWSRAVKTEIWGYPAHVLELKDGRLLCTYGYRKKPFGLRACLSRDGGKTWDIQREMVLRDDGGHWDLGYPSSVQLPDGWVLTVYWFNQEKQGDPSSETRFIGGTFYQP